jgi:hypothetical protein
MTTNNEHLDPQNDSTTDGLSEKLEYLKHQPAKFVRKANFHHHGESKPESFEEAIQIRDAHLARLAQYGVNIPKNETLGELIEEDRPVIYEASDRILGDELDLALVNKDPRVSAAKLGQHYGGLLSYMKSVYQEGGFYLSDITRNNQQAMLGHTADDPEDKIYLVDLEPLLAKFHPSEMDHPDNEAYFRALSLFESSVKLAKTFGQNVDYVLEEIAKFKTVVFRH